MSIFDRLDREGFESAHLDDVVVNVANDMASEANSGGLKDQVNFLLTVGGLDEDEIVEALEKEISLPGSVVKGVLALGVSGDVLDSIKNEYDVFMSPQDSSEFFLDALSYESDSDEAKRLAEILETASENLTGRYLFFYHQN